MKCAICGIRKPKRYCPGVRGDICTICCGTEREQTVDCPLGCEYLREAHRHGKAASDTVDVPNKDIEITESFVEEHQSLLTLLGACIYDAAVKAGPITDYDARDALESLVRTYRTMQSGLIYETRSPNPFAAAIYDAVQARVPELRRMETEITGSSTLRDSEVLGTLVFLQRLEYYNNNGRKRSKAFLDFLAPLHDMVRSEPEISVEPEAPRIIV